jgi:hypothetical protein
MGSHHHDAVRTFAFLDAVSGIRELRSGRKASFGLAGPGFKNPLHVHRDEVCFTHNELCVRGAHNLVCSLGEKH